MSACTDLWESWESNRPRPPGQSLIVAQFEVGIGKIDGSEHIRREHFPGFEFFDPACAAVLAPSRFSRYSGFACAGVPAKWLGNVGEKGGESEVSHDGCKKLRKIGTGDHN